MVARLDAIEAARLVRDHAGEHVETPGRAFRIGGGRNVVRQRQALDQRHDIDAARLEYRTVGEHDLVQLEPLDALRDRGATGQKARAHAISDLIQPQVEARRLNLVDIERMDRIDGAALEKRRNHVVRQNASLVVSKSERHRRASIHWFVYPIARLTERLKPRKSPLSRGHLSRPACSHVKQVAKKAGDAWTRRNDFRPGFCWAKEALMSASPAKSYRPETRLVHSGT